MAAERALCCLHTGCYLQKECGRIQKKTHLIHHVRHFAVKKTSSSLPPRVRTPKGFVTVGVDVWRKNNKWFTVMRGALLTKIMAYLHKKINKNKKKVCSQPPQCSFYSMLCQNSEQLLKIHFAWEVNFRRVCWCVQQNIEHVTITWGAQRSGLLI